MQNNECVITRQREREQRFIHSQGCVSNRPMRGDARFTPEATMLSFIA